MKRLNLPEREIVSLYLKNYTGRECAEIYGCSLGTIQKIIHKFEVMRTSPEARMKKQGCEDKIINYYLEGFSIQRCAEKFNCSCSPIERIIKDITEEQKLERKTHLKRPERSKETREKLSKVHNGKHLSEETKKRISESRNGIRKGILFTEEHKKNQAEGICRFWESDKSITLRNKLSEAMMGNRNPQYGVIPSQDVKDKISDALKGIKRSEETKKKISKSHFGIKQTDASKEKIRAARCNQKFPKSKTNIEKIVERQLKELQIPFVEQWNLGNKFQCDFYLPELDLIIECDGDYWHNLERVKKKDKAKNAYAKACDINMLRIWEHTIKSESFDILEHLPENFEC